jgi:hypothetical protein
MKILTSAAPTSPALEKLLKNPSAREKVLTFLTANSATQSANTQEIQVEVEGRRFSVSTSSEGKESK